MCALADLADSCSLLTRLVQQILLAPPRLPSKLASHVVEELKIRVVIEVVQKDLMYSLCSATGDIISDSQTGEFKWMVSGLLGRWRRGIRCGIGESVGGVGGKGSCHNIGEKIGAKIPLVVVVVWTTVSHLRTGNQRCRQWRRRNAEAEHSHCLSV